MDQGLGVGTHHAFFNRHTLSATRFCKLRDPAAGSAAPPWVLVVHARCAFEPLVNPKSLVDSAPAHPGYWCMRCAAFQPAEAS